jgi:hypothetical protein
MDTTEQIQGSSPKVRGSGIYTSLPSYSNHPLQSKMKCPICGGNLEERTEFVVHKGIFLGPFKARYSPDCHETILEPRAWRTMKKLEAVFDSLTTDTPTQFGTNTSPPIDIGILPSPQPTSAVSRTAASRAPFSRRRSMVLGRPLAVALET